MTSDPVCGIAPLDEPARALAESDLPVDQSYGAHWVMHPQWPLACRTKESLWPCRTPRRFQGALMATPLCGGGATYAEPRLRTGWSRVLLSGCRLRPPTRLVSPAAVLHIYILCAHPGRFSAAGVTTTSTLSTSWLSTGTRWHAAERFIHPVVVLPHPPERAAPPPTYYLCDSTQAGNARLSAIAMRPPFTVAPPHSCLHVPCSHTSPAAHRVVVLLHLPP